jgi:hypothetical protein
MVLRAGTSAPDKKCERLLDARWAGLTQLVATASVQAARDITVPDRKLLEVGRDGPA